MQNKQFLNGSYGSIGESFQDYSWIQDFEADFPMESRPQNPELRRLWFILSLSIDNWPF